MYLEVHKCVAYCEDGYVVLQRCDSSSLDSVPIFAMKRCSGETSADLGRETRSVLLNSQHFVNSRVAPLTVRHPTASTSTRCGPHQAMYRQRQLPDGPHCTRQNSQTFLQRANDGVLRTTCAAQPSRSVSCRPSHRSRSVCPLCVNNCTTSLHLSTRLPKCCPREMRRQGRCTSLCHASISAA